MIMTAAAVGSEGALPVRRVAMLEAIAAEEAATRDEPLPKRARFASGLLATGSASESSSPDFTVPYRPAGFYIWWLLKPRPVGRGLVLARLVDDLVLFCKPSRDLD